MTVSTYTLTSRVEEDVMQLILRHEAFDKNSLTNDQIASLINETVFFIEAGEVETISNLTIRFIGDRLAGFKHMNEQAENDRYARIILTMQIKQEELREQEESARRQAELDRSIEAKRIAKLSESRKDAHQFKAIEQWGGQANQAADSNQNAYLYGTDHLNGGK